MLYSSPTLERKNVRPRRLWLHTTIFQFRGRVRLLCPALQMILLLSTNATLVCVLSDIKFAVIIRIFLSVRSRYLGDGDPNRREILYDGRYRSRTQSFSFRGTPKFPKFRKISAWNIRTEYDVLDDLRKRYYERLHDSHQIHISPGLSRLGREDRTPSLSAASRSRRLRRVVCLPQLHRNQLTLRARVVDRSITHCNTSFVY